MGEEFVKLLEKIAAGECAVGTFVRRAVEENGKIVFSELLVYTRNGQTYVTKDQRENERFFNLLF